MYLLAISGALSAATGTAQWAQPIEMPVDRLIENTQRFIAEHPADAQGYYHLGRIHSFAFTRGLDTVRGYGYPGEEADAESLPSLPTDQRDPKERGGTEGRKLTAPETLAHLSAAVENSRLAAGLNEKSAQYHLGLAFVLEHGSHLAAHLNSVNLLPVTLKDVSEKRVQELTTWLDNIPKLQSEQRSQSVRVFLTNLDEALPLLNDRRSHADAVTQKIAAELLEGAWRECAIREYYRAFELALGDGLPKRQPFAPDGLNSLIVYEAGKSYLKLVRNRGVLGADETERVERVQAVMSKIEELPGDLMITPIVLSLEQPLALSELLDASWSVPFDLDGTGREQRWPWLQRDAALLTWDPEHTGRITSGRQLFGSVTWWLFFEDGYHAMDALDDDRNGWLSGAELNGLALWFDRDGDGVSAEDEVEAIECTEIEALCVRATMCEGLSPGNPEGLLRADGRRLPTYDWTTEPLRAEP